MLAAIEFAVDAAFRPSGTSLGPLWQGYSAGLLQFVAGALGMWFIYVVVAFGLRRLRGMAARERIVSAGLSGVLAYLALAALANLVSRTSRMPQMPPLVLLLLTLAIPTLLAAVLGPAVVRAVASRREKRRASR